MRADEYIGKFFRNTYLFASFFHRMLIYFQDHNGFISSVVHLLKAIGRICSHGYEFSTIREVPYCFGCDVMRQSRKISKFLRTVTVRTITFTRYGLDRYGHDISNYVNCTGRANIVIIYHR